MALAFHLWARGSAVLVGVLALHDILRGSVHRSDSLTAWWWNTGAYTSWLRTSLVVGSATLLLAYGWGPAMRPWRRRATQAVLIGLLACGLADALRAQALFVEGKVVSAYVPLSLPLAMATAQVLFAIRRRQRWMAHKAMDALAVSSAAGLCALLFAFGQMVCFGSSDYRRRADAVVVFGARVYADGAPSLALADRVRTGAALVRAGYAPVLVVSGGPGDGDIHEVEAMRDLAIAEGVPARAIRMDYRGVSTRATVRNTRAFIGPAASILAVSHGYHLPRIKLSYQQHGVRAYTVPARETRPLLRLPWFMTRESLAFWAHALRVA